MTLDFPWPQLIDGVHNSFLCDKHRLYFVDQGEISNIDIFDHQTLGSVSELPNPSYLWQLCDFGQAWLLTNGAVTVWKSGVDTLQNQGFDYAFSQSNVKFKAATAWQGRAFLGGFEPSATWLDEWKELFERNSVGLLANLSMQRNTLWWSTIGGDDLLWFMYPRLYIDGILGNKLAHSIDRPLILDYLDRNEAGFMQVSWPGEIQVVLPHTNGVFVAGTEGISFLLPIAEGMGFGERVVSRIGLLNQGAIAWTLNKKIFVGTDGALYQFTDRLDRLGYEEFFEGLESLNWLGSYDNKQQAYILSTDSFAFVYKEGLTMVTQPVFGHSGSKALLGDMSNNSFVVYSNVFDMGYREIKNIVSIWLQAESGRFDGLEVAVMYKMGRGEPFGQTAYRPVNKEGVVHIPCAGVEFKIAIRAIDYTNIDQVSGLLVTYNNTGKRWIRGLYADPTDEGTDSNSV